MTGMVPASLDRPTIPVTPGFQTPHVFQAAGHRVSVHTDAGCPALVFKELSLQARKVFPGAEALEILAAKGTEVAKGRDWIPPM